MSVSRTAKDRGVRSTNPYALALHCPFPECGRSLKSNAALTKHVRTYHSTNSTSPEPIAQGSIPSRSESPAFPDDAELFCPIVECDRSFKGQNGLTKHMRVCHPLHPVEPLSPIPADLPSRSATRPYVIATHQQLRHRTHVETHQGALPHENIHNQDTELQPSPQGAPPESHHASSPLASHPHRSRPTINQFHDAPQMSSLRLGPNDQAHGDFGTIADPRPPPLPHNSPPWAWDDLGFHDDVMYPDVHFHQDDWINHDDEEEDHEEEDREMIGADSDGEDHDGDRSGRIRRTYHPLINGERQFNSPVDVQ